MSASCEFSLNFNGSDEDFEKLIDKLYEIEGEKRENTRFFQPFEINGRRIFAHNGSARNIWGTFYLDPEADMYLELAKTVPNSSFEVESNRLYEGGGGGCETYLRVSYSDRKLTFKLQSGVDSIPLIDILASSEESCEDKTFVFAGETKIFENREALKEYVEGWSGEVKETVDEEADYLICNDHNKNNEEIEKAKVLGIPVISEAKFIRMFCDVYDFEDDLELLFEDFTYDEFCENFDVDEEITEEVFKRLCEDPYCESLVLSGDNCVSLDGYWDETVYVLGENGEFNN